MALTLNLVKSSVSVIDTDTTYTNLTDSTANYGTGGNPIRDAFAVFLAAFKVDVNLKETALSVQDYDPEDATTFVVVNSIDGHQKFKYCVIPRYTSATGYSLYDVVWSETEEKWYRAKLGGFSDIEPPNTTYWEEIADPSELIDNDGTSEESPNLQYQILETVLDISARQCLGQLAIDNSKEACDANCIKPNQLSKDVEALRSLVYWMQVADSRQLYTKGEKFARLSETYCGC